VNGSRSGTKDLTRYHFVPRALWKPQYLSAREDTMKRIQSKPLSSFQDRLNALAKDARAEAEKLPPGIERDNALRKIGQAETTAHLTEWANSPGLQPPK
jgi:hypothetical protein